MRVRLHSLGQKDEKQMLIVAVGWLYVALMMAITEHTVVAGIATFLLYGVAPVSIVLYIMGTPGRRKRNKARQAWEARQAQLAREAGHPGAAPDASGDDPASEPADEPRRPAASASAPGFNEPDRARSGTPSDR